MCFWAYLYSYVFLNQIAFDLTPDYDVEIIQSFVSALNISEITYDDVKITQTLNIDTGVEFIFQIPSNDEALVILNDFPTFNDNFEHYLSRVPRLNIQLELGNIAAKESWMFFFFCSLHVF